MSIILIVFFILNQSAKEEKIEKLNKNIDIFLSSIVDTGLGHKDIVRTILSSRLELVKIYKTRAKR